MTSASRSQAPHRWYVRPVLFVSDVNRALQFYIDKLGFENAGTQETEREMFARSITENARSFSAKTTITATKRVSSSS